MRIVFLGLIFSASAHYFHQSVLTTALITGLDAKKKNPWKKTVGKPSVKTPTYLKIWSDIEKKANWAINKIKKSASFSIETIIATQIFAAVIISMFMAIFKRLFKKKPKVQTGIPREKFIQLINLGYDKFKSKEEIQEFVQEDQLCELVAEEDLELVTALVQWDFEDEMEDEDDEHGELRSTWNAFAVSYRDNKDQSMTELWRKHFEEQTLTEVGKKLFI